MKSRRYVAAVAIVSFIVLAGSPLFSPVAAHESNKGKKPTAAKPIAVEETAFGRQGDPKKVTRTIEISMSDTMRFAPAELRIKQGETIRFVVRNGGKLMHEMVLGTMQELKAHGDLMKQNPGMEHDEPYQTHVKPDAKEELIWQFTKPGEFHYACLVAGHFEAGMIGRITVASK